MSKETKVYCILDNEVIEIGLDSCYKPDENGRFLVHLTKYGYEFFTLGKTAFFNRDQATAACSQ